MVQVVEGSVIIYRPVADVWTHLTVAQNLPTYLPGTYSISTDAPAGIVQDGSRGSGKASFMGSRPRWSGQCRGA